MKKAKILAAVLAAALSLSACGRVDDFGKKNGGAGAAVTSASTADQSEAPDAEPDDSEAPEITTVIPESIPDTESITGEIKIPDSSAESAVTTTKLPDAQLPETTTAPRTEESSSQSSEQTPDDPEPPAVPEPDPSEFLKKIRVIYNNIEFGLGDKMSVIESSLGEQANAPGIIFSNLSPDDIANEYYFYGMNIQVKNDMVYSIEITDNLYYGDTYGCTVGGLSLSSNRTDVENAHGVPSRSDDFNHYYESEGQSLQVTFGENGNSVRILITDKNI